MLRMDEVNKIRKAHFNKGDSIHAIARQYKRSWETIKRIVDCPREKLEMRGKRPNREKRVLTEEVAHFIRQILDQEEQQGVHKKQRYTTSRIYQELKMQNIYKGSSRALYKLVDAIRLEHTQSKPQGMLPLQFPLGSMLQVDHGEFECLIKDNRVKAYLFVAAVPGYQLRYCQAFHTKAKEAWGEFHERAFRFFGGIFSKVAYDNDSVLIKEVLGSEHRQTDFSAVLEEHYGFTSHYCNLASGNEKGAVENAVGYCRRNYLVGLPKVHDWESLNRDLDDKCSQDCVNEKAALVELTRLLDQLPPCYTWHRTLHGRVNSYQLVTAQDHGYSVPERYVGGQVRVSLGAFKVEIYHQDICIAQHARQYVAEEDSLVLDHYLDQLRRKPNALWDCKATQQHRFEPFIQNLWLRLESRHPLREANRNFIQVLLLGRKYRQEELAMAIELALSYGSIEAGAIENVLRQLNTRTALPNENCLKSVLSGKPLLELKFDLSPYEALCGDVFYANT